MRPGPSRLLVPRSVPRAGRASRSMCCGLFEEETLPRGASPAQNMNQPPPRCEVYSCIEKIHPASLLSPNPKPGEGGKMIRHPMQALC